jgi:hypothetical protein
MEYAGDLCLCNTRNNRNGNHVPPLCRQQRATHRDVLGGLLRDLNIAGLHQVMGDTAYKNHGTFRLGLLADPLS